jgi:hypothetical protein
MQFVSLIFVSLCLAQVAVRAAPWTEQNAPWNVNMNKDGSDPSRYFGIWSSDVHEQNITAALKLQKAGGDQRSVLRRLHSYFPSPDDWRSEGIYQVMTDRFSDGDPTNNEGRHFGFGGYDARFVNTRHGGDFKGLTMRLPYIKALGYTAIWVSPIFQNLENQVRLET